MEVRIGLVRDKAARARPEVRRHPHYEVGAQRRQAVTLRVPEVDSNPHEVALTGFLSPPCSRTRADTQRQGATKQRFYRGSALLNGQVGTGRDTHLRSDCGQSVGTSNNPLDSYSGLQ